MFRTQAQFPRGGKIRSAGAAGKVQDQRPPGQAAQLGRPQHRGRYGVDDRIKVRQKLFQRGQRCGMQPRAARCGPLFRRAGGNGHLPAQCLQPPGHRPPNAPIPQHEELTFPYRALAQLHQQGQAPFRSGYCVQAGQLRPQKVIHQLHPGGLRRFAHRFADAPAKGQCTGAGGAQDAGKVRRLGIHRHRQQDVIRLPGPLCPQHGIAAVLQRPRRRQLAGIPPNHTKSQITCCRHNASPRCCIWPFVPCYAGVGGMVPSEHQKRLPQKSSPACITKNTDRGIFLFIGYAPF